MTTKPFPFGIFSSPSTTSFIPKSLKIGDTIGVIAPSSPIVGDNIEELDQAKEIIEKLEIIRKKKKVS